MNRSSDSLSPGRRGGSSCVVPAAWKATLAAVLVEVKPQQQRRQQQQQQQQQQQHTTSFNSSSSSYNRTGRAKEETNGPLSSINHLERCMRPTTADARPTRPRRSHTTSKGEATNEGGPVARKLQWGWGSGDTAGCCCTRPAGARQDALGPSPTASHFHSTMRLQSMPAECASSTSMSMSSFSATRSRPDFAHAPSRKRRRPPSFTRTTTTETSAAVPNRTDPIRMQTDAPGQQLSLSLSL
jgi:hypothetical protein